MGEFKLFIIKKFIKKILKSIGWKLIKINLRKPNSFVNQKPNLNEIKSILNSEGILHLGAHRGKEAETYSWFNKPVLWIEANPMIFEDLTDNIRLYYKQEALNLLLGDQTKKVDFYISNKDASCSSIFDLSQQVKNGELWNEHKLKMIDKIKLNMIKFDDAVDKYKIELSKYNHWIIDLQGSEIQFLKGAKKSLSLCKSIFIEISKKKFYAEGSTSWNELKFFLKENGFINKSEPSSDHCDILFTRIENEK